MKRKTLFGIRIFAVCLFALFCVSFIPALIGLGLGAGLAFAAGAAEVITGEPNKGTVTTKKASDASEDLLTDTISKKITEMRPSLHPIDTIMRQLNRKKNSPSWKYAYYAVDVRGIRDHVTESKTVDALNIGGGVETNQIFDIKVANLHIWQTDDNIFFQNISGSDGLPLVGNVTKKESDKLKVFFINRKPAEFIIPAETGLTRIGNSKSELDAQTSSYAIMPQQDYNYNQIHMAQVEEGVYKKIHSQEVDWNLNNYRVQSIYDMRRSMELTSLVGVRGLDIDPTDQEQKHFSGGLLRYIDKKLDVPAAGITHDTFVDWTKAIFTGNSGSDTRFLFGGCDLISELSKVETIYKQIEAKNTEVKYGITFNKIETNFGVLLVKHHQLLTELGLENLGCVLDMNNVERAVYKPMAVRELELIKSGQRMANAYVIDEAYCPVLLYPDTHCIIAGADVDWGTS